MDVMYGSYVLLDKLKDVSISHWYHCSVSDDMKGISWRPHQRKSGEEWSDEKLPILPAAAEKNSEWHKS